MNREIFKTKESLQEAIDNPGDYEGMEEYLDNNFAYLMFDLDGGREKRVYNGELFDIPYWIELYCREEYQAQYREGYYEPLKIGTIKNFNDQEYKYIDSQALTEEMEHQADNGTLAYEYRGYSFLRIWEKL